MRGTLLTLLLLAFTTHARLVTTTVAGEIIVATVFTDADDDVITSTIDTVGTVTATARTTGTRKTSASIIPDTTTDTYLIPAPTRTAVLAPPTTPANKGYSSIQVTAATVAVPEGTVQPLGDFQSSISAAQATVKSGAVARVGAGAGVGAVVAAVAVVGFMV